MCASRVEMCRSGHGEGEREDTWIGGRLVRWRLLPGTHCAARCRLLLRSLEHCCGGCGDDGGGEEEGEEESPSSQPSSQLRPSAGPAPA